MDKSIPRWITIGSIGISLLGLFVGASLYISPSTFLKNIDLSAVGILYPIQMWAARQIAIATIIGYSALKKSTPILKISLLAYALMTGQDVFIGISRGDNGLVLGSLFFCLLSVMMLRTLVMSTKKLTF